MNVLIGKSVGKGGVNDKADVLKIQELLNRVRAPLNLKLTGTCDPNTISDIESMQRLWGTPDGKIDPAGGTLARLNGLTHPLVLGNISLEDIRLGGYKISYSGNRPPSPYRLLLYISKVAPSAGRTGETVTVEENDYSVDVTQADHTNLITFATLPKLLYPIGKQKLWGTTAHCTLYVACNGAIVSQSASKRLACPVQPLAGPLCPQIGAGDGGPRLTYTGIQTGRVLYPAPLDGKYFFSYKQVFETDNDMRGFNCITYVGGVFGVDVNSGAMGAYGTKLVEYLGGTACDMECKKGKEVKTWFETHSNGTYFVWSEGHIFLVVNGTVHEFTTIPAPGGYRHPNIQAYEFSGRPVWVRKSPKDFL